jgi:hypothetical protein
MHSDDQSRRQLLLIAATGAAAASAVIASTGLAQAYQGNMERALAELNSALISLRRATADKGGHKGRAMNLIQQAMGEVQAGIDYAASKFGD